VPVNAVYGFTNMVLKLLREQRPAYVGVVFDAPGPTFRDELFASYKANRPAMPADLVPQLPLVREIADALALRVLSVPGVEADDVIGTVAHAMASHDVDVVVVTADKDLMQLVTAHVSLWDTMRDRRCDVDGVRARFGVRPDQVVDLLGLMGDASDNIPGVSGIGEKTATALIQRFGSIENLLTHLDDLEASPDVRGAKKLAATLRIEADTARLSRTLAVVRRDVPVPCALSDFHYDGPHAAAFRAVCTRLGFQSLVRDLPGPPEGTRAPARRLDDEGLVGMVVAAQQAGRLAFACRRAADGDDPGRCEVVLGVGDTVAVAPVAAGTPGAARLLAVLADSQVEKVTHDLKRDLLLFDDRSVPEVSAAFDVMLASYLLEASATHRLEDLATDEVGVRLERYRDGAEDLAAGVALLPALGTRLAQRLRDTELDALFRDVEMPLVSVLAGMERRGVCVDVDMLRAMGREMAARLDAHMAEIYALAGGPFNIASPPQLRAVLFERLGLSRKGVRKGKTGLSTDVDVLTRLAGEHPLPAKILEYRALAKLKSTYVDTLPAAVNPATGRLHTSFNQTVAATGRLSSSDPNLQNIPIRGDDGRRIRAAFVAPAGQVLVVADYSQIELRVLAHLSEDPALLSAFRAGDDVHARTAAEVFGVLPGIVTAEMRRTAKVINFGIIYGMGPQRLARELGIPLADAERYIASYFERYAGVRAYMARVQAEARTRGYVTTLLGRRRSFPDLASPHRGVVQAAERAAANTPIQGSAADLIKLAMLAVERRVREARCAAAMILQVHDELVFEVAADQRAAAVPLIRAAMEEVYPLGVPLRVDIGWGPNWAAAHG
jgi:DNA polymerase-1